MMIPKLPEVASYVDAYDQALRDNKQAMLDEALRIMDKYEERGITTIKGSGWPLRPVFLERKYLDFLSHSLFQGFDQLRLHLLEHCKDIDYLVEKLPLPRAMFEVLDFEEHLRSPSFLSILRPDGFLAPDKYTLIEPNFGNGSLISNAYTEILYDYFQGCPVFQELGWDLKKSLDRPLQKVIDLVQSYLPASKEKPLVALFCHSWEHKMILSWEERVIQQLYLAQQAMAERGIETEVVFEDGFRIDEQGLARLQKDDRVVDCVLQFTIGTSFMDEPELFETEFRHLRGAKIGHAPWLKPLAALCVDKGTMPLLEELPCWPFESEDGFQVQLPTTTYPIEENAPEYRKNRERYVLKKSFDGKHTFVGASTLGRQWNRVLQQALQSQEYVIQDYAPLTRTTMPMCFDGKEIEWIPVRVELSPFIIDGKYAGAIARYAPDEEGLVMSPPPENMGLTNVFACE